MGIGRVGIEEVALDTEALSGTVLGGGWISGKGSGPRRGRFAGRGAAIATGASLSLAGLVFLKLSEMMVCLFVGFEGSRRAREEERP